MNNSNFKKSLGATCQMFRKYRLKKTLKEVSELAGISISTLSNFEQGHSSNVSNLLYYIIACDNIEQVEFFNSLVSELINRYAKEKHDR